jgi:hypothetical protein
MDLLVTQAPMVLVVQVVSPVQEVLVDQELHKHLQVLQVMLAQAAVEAVEAVELVMLQQQQVYLLM